MIWPGASDPYKRKKTLKFLAVTAIIGVSVAASAATLQLVLSENDPLKVCINDRDTPYRISATLELWVDGRQADVPANIGFNQGELGECQRSMYTITNDGTIYAEWEEEYPFEIGHFLWMWDFPIRDMVESDSAVYVNDVASPHFIRELLEDGAHYRAEFVSKEYDETVDRDFLPPTRDE